MDQLTQLTEEVAQLKSGHDYIVKRLNKIDNDNETIISILQTGRHLVKFFVVAGSIVKWGGGLAIAFVAMWSFIMAIKTGKPPSIFSD